MLEGFYGGHRKVTKGSNGRGHLDPQAMLWSRSLRGTHDNIVKKLREEMAAKRRDRLRKNGAVRQELPSLHSEEEIIAPPRHSASQIPSCSQDQTPSDRSPRSRRSKSAEVQGAKKLLRMLHLDHMLSDETDEDAAEPKKRKGKSKAHTPPSTSSQKVRPKADVKSSVSPLTSWRMDASLPESLREKPRDHVTMSSQKTVKEQPVESDQSGSEEEDEQRPHVTQWRYKPLPGEARNETRRSGEQDRANPKSNRKSTERLRHSFDLDDLRIVVVAMQKEHRQCMRSMAESLEHHTRQIVLLTKANSSLADHVDNLQKEMKVLRAMQFVCSTIP